MWGVKIIYTQLDTIRDKSSKISLCSVVRRAGKHLGFLGKVFRFFKVFLKVFLDFSVLRQHGQKFTIQEEHHRSYQPFSLSLCFLQIITKPTNLD